MIKTTMTRWMGAGTLALVAGLAGCASGTGMQGTSSGTAGAGGVAGAVNPAADTMSGRPADTTSGRAADTTGRAVPPASAASPAGQGVSMGGMFANLGGDARIATAIDVANTGEIEAGQVARQRARNSSVRAFADRMVRDHTRMQAQDRTLGANPALVESDSTNVMGQMRRQNDVAVARLRSASPGAQFDSMYVNQQVDAHRQTLALLTAARTQAQDQKLRDAIDAAIPQVQSHLDQATGLQRTLGSASPADTSRTP